MIPKINRFNDAIDRFKQKQLMPKETAETLKIIRTWRHQNFISYQKYIKSTILENRLLVLNDLIFFYSQCSEAVVWRCSFKKVLLEISLESQYLFK